MNNYELVKYHNDLNQLSFEGCSAADKDIFMAICTQVRDRGTNEVVLFYDQIKDLAGITWNCSIGEFNEILRRFRSRLMAMNCMALAGFTELDYHIFDTLRCDADTRTLTVRVSERGRYLLNDLVSQFTAFELGEFTSIKSKNAKALYCQLKQFRSTGKWIVTIDELKRCLNMNGCETKVLMRDVVRPAVETLRQYFKGLSYTADKARTRGHPVIRLTFTFERERIQNRDAQTNDMPVLQSQSSTLRPEVPLFANTKERHNRFPRGNSRARTNAWMNYEQHGDYDYDAIEAAAQASFEIPFPE